MKIKKYVFTHKKLISYIFATLMLTGFIFYVLSHDWNIFYSCLSMLLMLIGFAFFYLKIVIAHPDIIVNISVFVIVLFLFMSDVLCIKRTMQNEELRALFCIISCILTIVVLLIVLFLLKCAKDKINTINCSDSKVFYAIEVTAAIVTIIGTVANVIEKIL